MTEITIQTMTPSERLADIIARGIAAYQARWPDYAEPVVEPEPVTDKAEAEPAPPPTPPHIHLTEERQREICLACALPECVDVTHPRCPIRIEQRAEWRRQNHRKLS